jgi:UDP-N-acetylglucosamine 3-dehydrogenase
MATNRFEPVRLGVVGLGSFGTLHAQTAAGIAEAELTAVVARREASVAALREKLPARCDVAAFLDLDKAIAEADVEAWIVASSTASHVPITAKLLEAGHTVLLEKPIADNLKEAATLESLVTADSDNLMMGHILLFNSELLQLMEEVQRRGPISYIDCARHRPTTTLEVLPGESPFHLTMVHDLYAVLALTHRAEPNRFSAQTHRNESGHVDLAIAQLQWPGGMTASFTASFLTPPGMAADGFDRMEIFGRGWAARTTPNPRPLEMWDDRAQWPMALEIRADPDAPGGMLAEQMRCFCRVVRGRRRVPMGATYQDAMQVERWLDKLVVCAAD